MPAKKTSTTKKAVPKTPAAKKKIEKVMHELKEGTLKTSAGKKVTSRQQGIAIALNEAGLSKKKPAKKKSPPKKK